MFESNMIEELKKIYENLLRKTNLDFQRIIFMNNKKIHLVVTVTGALIAIVCFFYFSWNKE